eukprot:TRINITY_DN137_c2_g1_i2.p1 TRINITY_DN137_c2_g1~~TRINITY_DN137_c2_g1_i2.p1  ORF type:complete len:259 (+),score=10.58 TRINITY_DN137_c2_g1_i2:39-815(+)
MLFNFLVVVNARNPFPRSCYRLWDQWLIDYELNMVTPAGHMIPMLMSIGNHEAGGYDKKYENIAFYMSWFPQQTSVASSPVTSRDSYHAHRISDKTVLLSLDSGIGSKSFSDQTDWVTQQFADASSLPNKLVMYHVPMYPSYRSFSDWLSSDLRDEWLPIFDANHVALAFENHDHMYKRTFPLRSGQISTNGTVYVGDGAWGVVPRSHANPANSWYLANSQPVNFVFRVDIGTTNTTLTAIGQDGVAFDTFVVPFYSN